MKAYLLDFNIYINWVSKISETKTKDFLKHNKCQNNVHSNQILENQNKIRAIVSYQNKIHYIIAITDMKQLTNELRK
jgi:hypothetical protein